MSFSKVTHQPGIRPAGGTAQMMIKVSHEEPPPEFGRQGQERMEQYHGIQAAGYCHQHFLPGLEQLAGQDLVFNSCQQISHEPMLARLGAFRQLKIVDDLEIRFHEIFSSQPDRLSVSICLSDNALAGVAPFSSLPMAFLVYFLAK